MHSLAAFLLLAATAFARPLDDATEWVRIPRLDVGWEAVVRATAAQIETSYVDPTTGARCSAALLAELNAGRFDSVDDARAFARQVTEILGRESDDMHLALRYRPKPTAGVEDLGTSWQQELSPDDRSNHGFRAASVLPGNIGYLDIRHFAPLDEAEATATAALGFLSNVDAYIIDLRDNPGGMPSMARWLCSYFFEEQVPLASTLTRGDAQPRDVWTIFPFPLTPRPHAPICVLVSDRTFSAAESLTRWLQFHGRAAIVGERTPGGAHLSPEYRVDDRFVVSIPIAQVLDPDGKTWEAGIVPDVLCAADSALARSEVLLLEQLVNQVQGDEKRLLEWRLDDVRTGFDPAVASLESLTKLVGRYGPRTVTVHDGDLLYRRDEDDLRVLHPLGGDRFSVEGLDWFRVRFERDERGIGARLYGLYRDGREDLNSRDAS